MTLHNVLKPYTNRIIRSLLKTHFVKTKHIKMRRDIDDFFVPPKHLEKCSYEVLTRHRRHVSCKVKLRISSWTLYFADATMTMLSVTNR